MLYTVYVDNSTPFNKTVLHCKDYEVDMSGYCFFIIFTSVVFRRNHSAPEMEANIVEPNIDAVKHTCLFCRRH